MDAGRRMHSLFSTLITVGIASFGAFAHAEDQDRLIESAAHFLSGEIIFAAETSDGEILWRMTSTSKIEDCVLRSDAIRIPINQDLESVAYDELHYQDDPRYNATRYTSLTDLSQIADQAALLEFSESGFNIDIGYQSRQLVTGTVPLFILRNLTSPEKYQTMVKKKTKIPDTWRTQENKECSLRHLMANDGHAMQCFRTLGVMSLSLNKIEHTDHIAAHAGMGGIGWTMPLGGQADYNVNLGPVMIALPFANFDRASYLMNHVIEERCRISAGAWREKFAGRWKLDGYQTAKHSISVAEFIEGETRCGKDTDTLFIRETGRASLQVGGRTVHFFPSNQKERKIGLGFDQSNRIHLCEESRSAVSGMLDGISLTLSDNGKQLEGNATEIGGDSVKLSFRRIE